MKSLRHKLLFTLCVILVLVSLVFVAWKGPPTPEGRYTASSSIGAEGDFWWELSNGKLEFVHQDGREYFGRYTNSPKGSYWIDDRRGKTNVFRIDSTWWRLKMVDDKRGGAATWGYRRFW